MKCALCTVNCIITTACHHVLRHCGCYVRHCVHRHSCWKSSLRLPCGMIPCCCGCCGCYVRRNCCVNLRGCCYWYCFHYCVRRSFRCVSFRCWAPWGVRLPWCVCCSHECACWSWGYWCHNCLCGAHHSEVRHCVRSCHRVSGSRDVVLVLRDVCRLRGVAHDDACHDE